MTEMTSAPRAQTARRLATKVPEIALIFWVLKLLSTGIGEVVSDYAGSVSTTYGAIVITAGFGLAMWLQLRQRHYRAAYYWSAVLGVAVFGTMVADGIHGDLGFGYAVTTPGFALITALIFLWWYRSEGTLSIHTIDSPRRERFYWAAVFSTFALGTAAGDFTATTLNLGFLDSILLFAGVICIPAVGWWRFNMNPIFAFWFAYVITRPLGASFSDWFSKPVSGTGLGLGNGTSALIGLLVFIPIVAWVAITKFDVQPGHGLHPHAHQRRRARASPDAAAVAVAPERRVDRHNRGLMSARPDEALTRWLVRQSARAAQFAAAHETTVDVAVALLIAAASFVGLATQDRLDHRGPVVFCLLLCAPLAVRGRSRSLCFALVAGVALAQWLTSTPQIADVAVLVALYWLALDGRRSRSSPPAS